MMDAKWLDKLGMVARTKFLGNAYPQEIPGNWDNLHAEIRSAWRGVAEAVLLESRLLPEYSQEWSDFAPWETVAVWIGANVDPTAERS